MNNKKICLSLLHSIVLAPLGYAAVVPDSGEALRQFQKPSLPLPVKTDTPELKLDEKTPPTKNIEDKTTLLIRDFKITGNTLFSENELRRLVDELKGKQHTLSELQAGVDRITAFYHTQGYLSSRAYLPEQDIQQGIVTIAILEGKMGGIKLNNQSRLSEEQTARYFNAIKPGMVIQSDPLNRALLLLSDTPGIKTARATLQPGASAGSSDMLIDISPSAPYSGQIGFDNYGNRYTGQYRLNGQLKLNSPFKWGDQLSLNILQSSENLNYGRAAWHVPVGGQGLMLGAAIAGTRYHLGKEFSNLDAHGSATIASAIATYPFVRTSTTNVFGSVAFEHKHLHDAIESASTTDERQLQQINFGFSGQQVDPFIQGGITSMDATFSLGKLRIHLPDVLAIDQATLRSHGDFARLAVTIRRQQQLSERQSLSIQLSGQMANKNLNSSEKFSIGGINGVKAYPEGEGIGDDGILANIAWNVNLNNDLQSGLFYDVGSVRINHDASLIAGNNRRTLSGAGINLNATIAKIQLKSYVAWRLNGGETITEPDHNPRLWTEATVPF